VVLDASRKGSVKDQQMLALPFAIAFGRPRRGELLSLGGMVILAGSAASWAVISAHPWHAEPKPDELALTALQVASVPPGAQTTIDGQPRGTTPISIDLMPGRHQLSVAGLDAIEETRTVDLESAGASVQFDLWRAQPTIAYLKPPLPGATLGDARFLADGRVGLQVVLPDGEDQAWALDGSGRSTSQRLGDISAYAPLAIRPDGQAAAVLRPRANQQPRGGPTVLVDHAPLGEVWLDSAVAGVAPQHLWTVPDPNQELVDLDWAPDGRHLLVVSRQPVSGGAARTVISWLDTGTGESEDLAVLPSEVAAGTYVWSPDGRTGGFVVHTASLAAVCTLSVSGEFRYLGDLNHDGLLGPPVAPVAWAPDGRVVYGALVSQTPAATSSASFAQNPAGLFVSDPPEAPGQSFSPTPALVPLWRSDGRLLSVGLPSGQETGLQLRELDEHGNARSIARIDVPAPGPTAYGVRWDLARQRALVITNRGSSSGPAHDFWLVDFGWGTAS
jgi:hypothetical protein